MAKQGLGDAMRSFALAPSARQRAMLSGVQARAGARANMERARKLGIEGDLAQMRLDTLSGGLAEHFSPEAVALMQAGQGNAAQLAQGARTFEELQMARNATEEGDLNRANINLLAAGRQPYQPFAQTASGSVLHRGTGAVDQSSPLARATVAKLGAQAGQAGAAASLATARREQLLPAQVAAQEALVAQRGRQTQTGGAPTTDFRQMQELIAQNVDPQVAQAVGYGTLKMYKALDGSVTVYDPLTNTVVYQMDAMGNVLRDPNWGMSGTLPAVVGGAPPPVTPAAAPGSAPAMIRAPSPGNPLGLERR